MCGGLSYWAFGDISKSGCYQAFERAGNRHLLVYNTYVMNYHHSYVVGYSKEFYKK
jgi:hypothetical protein